MNLWTDIVSPVELTMAARVGIEERERTRVSLATFLPNRTVDDIAVRLTTTESGLVPVAEYRSYDAETPLGATPGGKHVTVDLPALGQKIRVSEYDQLRMRHREDSDLVRNSIGKVAIRVGQAVADRMELARGKVLAEGGASIFENGFYSTADFGRHEDLTINVAKKWTESGATPLTDIQDAVEKYIAVNGVEPGTLLVSRKTVAALLRSEEIRKTASGNTPTMVNRNYVDSLLDSFGLPGLFAYDRKVRTQAGLQAVIPDNMVLLLPSADHAEELGSTFWGTTLEAMAPNYGLTVDDRPGIVAGAYREEDPMGVWVKAAAIGLPVLANPNLVATLTVA
ncbi:major capsid protein [Corynebacterium lizhenjunii]|uniref:Major capsid protein n=1 Tax=Corynebacterium lizhenjunii TaxID=2709394 RepID=A0A7T0P9T2_9CORY|nr:major capsid protein [Corynebacterium lizhenjunii]QPK78271.1 major capsid protein [Corynebacterium lizhenjunii]